MGLIIGMIRWTVKFGWTQQLITQIFIHILNNGDMIMVLSCQIDILKVIRWRVTRNKIVIILGGGCRQFKKAKTVYILSQWKDGNINGNYPWCWYLKQGISCFEIILKHKIMIHCVVIFMVISITAIIHYTRCNFWLKCLFLKHMKYSHCVILYCNKTFG